MRRTPPLYAVGFALKIRVSTNMLLLDVCVRDRSLAVDLLQRFLNSGFIIYLACQLLSHLRNTPRYLNSQCHIYHFNSSVLLRNPRFGLAHH